MSEAPYEDGAATRLVHDPAYKSGILPDDSPQLTLKFYGHTRNNVWEQLEGRMLELADNEYVTNVYVHPGAMQWTNYARNVIRRGKWELEAVVCRFD